MTAITTEAETADMRDSIATQILNWADGADWEDDQNAERVFEKLAEAPERFISPNPGENVSWAEEASRIYHKIKAEHGLRTVDEARAEADDFDDRARRHAVEVLRDHGEEVAAEVADEFGWDFVVDVLGSSLEELAAAVVDDFEVITPDDDATDDEPTIEEQAAEVVDDFEIVTPDDELTLEEQAAALVESIEVKPTTIEPTTPEPPLAIGADDDARDDPATMMIDAARVAGIALEPLAGASTDRPPPAARAMNSAT